MLGRTASLSYAGQQIAGKLKAIADWTHPLHSTTLERRMSQETGETSLQIVTADITANRNACVLGPLGVECLAVTES